HDRQAGASREDATVCLQATPMTAGPGSLRPMEQTRANTSIVAAAACHDRRDEDAAGVCEEDLYAASMGFSCTFLCHHDGARTRRLELTRESLFK
ncbi:MAG: hypothetical protein ACPIOQ_43215, partial [Promethearchaeia archaeon]